LNDGTFAVKRFKTNLGTNTSSLATSDGMDSASQLLATLKQEFEEEIEILNKFSGNTHRHLISLLAAYQRGNDCCLLFHWANCDLKKMWEDQEPGDPLDKRNLEWVLEQCQGIANGLRQIHCHQTTEVRTGRLSNGGGLEHRIYGRHGDIKPDNILLFRSKDEIEPHDRGTLVIADFGLTRFHSDHTRTYFPKRSIPATPTYRPPECDMENCAISRSFDIWSYGCVLLEFITWYLGGWTLVKDFVQKRQAPNVLLHNFNSDQFFEIVRSKGDSDGRVCVRVKEEVAQVRQTPPKLRSGGFY
jgi:serine/threonine protein kinase